MNSKSSKPITDRRAQEPKRRQFLGGSDARIIMCPDEAALIRLWREKRGESLANLRPFAGLMTSQDKQKKS